MHPTYNPESNIMNLYNSVKVAKGKSKNPENALNKAKKLKALKDV